MVDFRPILYVNGILLCILSLVMLVPMLVDLAYGHEDWQVFLVSSFFTAFIGGGMFLANRGYEGSLSLRQAFLFTTTSYVVVSIFCSLPLYWSELQLPFVDAYFESVSGITSTGSTVLTGLDFLPPGILVWRSLLNAMGGIGIVVLALAVLPMLRIGGMQLFKTESSDTMDKMFPRTTQIAAVISLVFVVLMILCALSYWWAGMSGFDAMNHAMTTVATGGFSTHDASLGYYDSRTIEAVATLFMIAGGIPIILYFQAIKGSPEALWQNTQVQSFLGIILGVTLLLMFWLIVWQDFSVSEALRYSLFNVVSIITTTGYASTDYNGWGPFAVAVFFMLIVVGGCTGSTSGGIKIFRFQVLYKTARVQIRQLIQPHGVFIPLYNSKPITESISASVMSFFILFAFCFVVLAVILSFYGLDFLTAMSAAAQSLSNVGPGLGELIGPAGNYSILPDGAKWWISGAMIMGRLELFTVIVILAPHFWRQ